MPVEVAIAATAVVHLANNLFKLTLVGRHADVRVVLRFAVPAALAALGGAWLLTRLTALAPLVRYKALGAEHAIDPLHLVVGLLVAGFALLELSPRFARFAFPPSALPLGGLLSGFFGGLTGNQGALRSAFLIKAGLGKEAFIGTGVVAAVVVDLSRLAVYGSAHAGGQFVRLDSHAWVLVGVASLAAFAGAWLGVRMLHKVTLRALQLIVAWAMVALGLALALGLV
jgi:uncharacterized membrane protein YfcA